MNMEIFIIHFIIISLIISFINSEYIILPFKSTYIKTNLNNNNNSIDNVSYYLSELDINQIYSTLSFGNPTKYLEFYLTMEQSFFAVLSNYCLKGSYSSYNPNSSKKISKLSYDTMLNLKNASYAEDKCSFYNDLNLTENIDIDYFHYLLGNWTGNKNYIDHDSNKFCGSLGLMKYYQDRYFPSANLINYFKEDKEIIDSYSWGVFFFDKEDIESYNIDKDIQNKYDGFCIIGITEKDYLNIFKTSNVINDYLIRDNYIETIRYSFDKIYFNDNSNNNKNIGEIICAYETQFEFHLDYNYIISGKEYYDKIKQKFFKKYLDNRACMEENSKKFYDGQNHMIICDYNFKKDIKYFPNLYFLSRKLSFIFELNYNDIFLEENNKIYFLIIGKDMYKSVWKFGKIFMKKYPFIFDQDRNTISFVHLDKFDKKPNNNQVNNIESKNKSFIQKIFECFLYSLLFIGILIGIFIGKRIWNKHRKLKANELEEKFDYTSQDKKIMN